MKDMDQLPAPANSGSLLRRRSGSAKSRHHTGQKYRFPDPVPSSPFQMTLGEFSLSSLDHAWVESMERIFAAVDPSPALDGEGDKPR